VTPPPPQADVPPTPDEMRIYRLLAEADKCLSECWHRIGEDEYPAALEARRVAVKELRAAIAAALSTTAARYREALEPFAKLGAVVWPGYRDDEPYIGSVTIGDLRRAAAILASGLQTTPQAAPAEGDER
jgi:hypothetical protein